MADEQPTNGELARGIADLKLMVATLIGRAEYASDQRSLAYRLDELVRDLERERQERIAGVKAVNGRLEAQAQAGLEHRRHWRELLWQGALPALATLVVGLLALWAAHSGGH